MPLQLDLSADVFETTLARVALPAASPAPIQAHLDNLTKPQGSLGRLEELALRLGVLAGGVPAAAPVAVAVFAGDHGVTAQGVSAYPSAVTRQMVLNFLSGGAAVNVLARRVNAELWVVDAGVAGEDFAPHPQLLGQKVAPGTADFSVAAAMTPEQTAQALNLGAAVAHALVARGAGLLVAGEMGIGNTSSATALASLVTGTPPEALTGRGTGLDDKGLAHKTEVLKKAVALHGPQCQGNLREMLGRVGGLEVAALAGFFVGGAAAGRPVVVDGFISQSAALWAITLKPQLRPWLFFSHQSNEQGGAKMLALLGERPYLDMDMRLGEGTGALLLTQLMQSACAVYHEMATFASASVSGPA